MKRILLISLIALTTISCDRFAPFTSEGLFDRAIEELKEAETDIDRFYALGDAAKTAFEIGRYGEAKEYAEELEELTPKFPRNWNYGNAVQDFNLVFGRLALRDGEKEKAIGYLFASGRTPGSPQLGSFGPNMSLAKDLLEAGETEAVLQYFELCRNFWEMGERRLDRWTEQVEKGKIPDFGPNLVY